MSVYLLMWWWLSHTGATAMSMTYQRCQLRDGRFIDQSRIIVFRANGRTHLQSANCFILIEALLRVHYRCKPKGRYFIHYH
ncbi:hypothetical protein CC80DRAFT_112493 [Byssothecium circinans]|uniref:Secreted protein n=1 Tax=Byssothecium circinans TaxID=147558 RepID=A0A6A5TS44_9PLEO|nr:hypothetical protein CC80DRAFT_112493 [Byssothecium circinans]